MLKKWLTCALCACLIVGFSTFSIKPLFYHYANEFEIYTGTSSERIYHVKENEFCFVFDARGEACLIDKDDFSLDVFLKEFSAKIIKTEQTDNGVSYYAVAPKMRYSVWLFNQTVNLHVFVGESTVKVASPIIYGSF